MADLNSRLDRPVPIDRFRPNIVARGAGPFAEDTWGRFEIGGLAFHAVKMCERCVVTTIDQQTAQKGEEPLRTLAEYRTIDGKVRFGVNLVHLAEGVVERGARITF